MGVLGDILVRGITLWESVSGNITATRKFLRQTGTGAVSALPVWDTLVNGDLPDTAVTPGTYGDSTHVSRVTINQKGVITGASSVAITYPSFGDVSGPSSAVADDFAQFNGVTGKVIKDGGLSLTTSVGSPGVDTKIPSEKAVRSAIAAAGGGDVSGPASAVDGRVVLFDGTTGKLIKQAAAQTGTGAPVFATSPALVTPDLGVPAAGSLGACTNYPASALSGLGSSVAAFLAVALRGTSFPVSPSTNDYFYRTDLNNLQFFYDGTQWRSVTVFSHSAQFTNLAGTAAVGNWSPKYPSASDIWLIDMRVVYNISSNHTSSNYWTFSFHKYNNITDATIVSFDSDKSTTTWNAPAATTIGALLGSSNVETWFQANKTGTPGNLTVGYTFDYQIVAT